MPELGKLEWGRWLYGLISGFVSGGATAATGGITVSAIDPQAFALGGANSLKVMAVLFLVSGVTNALNYLKQHPLPEEAKQ